MIFYSIEYDRLSFQMLGVYSQHSQLGFYLGPKLICICGGLFPHTFQLFVIVHIKMHDKTAKRRTKVIKCMQLT